MFINYALKCKNCVYCTNPRSEPKLCIVLNRIAFRPFHQPIIKYICKYFQHSTHKGITSIVICLIWISLFKNRHNNTFTSNGRNNTWIKNYIKKPCQGWITCILDWSSYLDLSLILFYHIWLNVLCSHSRTQHIFC